MNLIKKWTSKLNMQSLIVAMCILFVCIGTQQIQTVKWDTGKIDFFRDSLGVVMAVILFTHYKRENLAKYRLAYIIWTVTGLLGCAIAVPLISKVREAYLLADTIVIALGIFLMGYCIIYTLLQYVVEKKRPKFFMPLLVIWVVMLVWMIFSKSDYWWPECYFVLFLCYYMTEQTPGQRRNVIQGIVNGLILGFIVIQAHALFCRPYDSVRYCGNFCNPNNNCLYLCFSLTAILAKLLFMCRKEGNRLWKVGYYLLAGACYAMIFMTISRTGYLTTFVITLLFLVAYCRLTGKRSFIQKGMLLVTVFVVMLPVTYLAIRYVPTIHPHVLFYFQEGYSEERVHSWDPRDSEKYVSFQELLESAVGRFAILAEETTDLTGKKHQETGTLLVASAENELPAYAVTVLTESVQTTTDAVLSEESDAFAVRLAIYEWFFTHLTLRGMPYDEQGFQLTPTRWIQHAHNIYLDYGINFGYPVLILFTVFVWWGIGRLTGRGWKTKEPEKFACLLMVLVSPVFGLLEYAWGTGTIATVVFYLMFKEMLSPT